MPPKRLVARTLLRPDSILRRINEALKAFRHQSLGHRVIESAAYYATQE